MGLSARKMARVWSENASTLSHWVMQHAVTATDSAMGYPTRKEASQGVPPEPVEETIDPASLQRHFATKDPQDLLGIPTMAGNGDTKLLVIELESDATTALPTPGVLFQAALHWQERLQQAGFEVALEACTPAGAFRLWILFDFPVEAERVISFGMRITQDYSEIGLNHPPRIYPNQQDGQYLRLPGMHPVLDCWSLFWVVLEGTDTGLWMEGHDAAETFMQLKPVSGLLMREHLPPVAVEPMGIEPTLTPDGRQWLSAQESEHARSVLAAIDSLSNIDKEATAQHPSEEIPTPDATTPPPLPETTTPSAEHLDKPSLTLEALSARTGLGPEAIQTKLLDWILTQDDATQDIILGQIPEGFQGDLARMILERMQTDSQAA